MQFNDSHTNGSSDTTNHQLRSYQKISRQIQNASSTKCQTTAELSLSIPHLRHFSKSNSSIDSATRNARETAISIQLSLRLYLPLHKQTPRKREHRGIPGLSALALCINRARAHKLKRRARAHSGLLFGRPFFPACAAPSEARIVRVRGCRRVSSRGSPRAVYITEGCWGRWVRSAGTGVIVRAAIRLIPRAARKREGLEDDARDVEGVCTYMWPCRLPVVEGFVR